MSELFIKSEPEEILSRNEITFRMLSWVLARVENPDARKLLIEAIAMLARDE